MVEMFSRLAFSEDCKEECTYLMYALSVLVSCSVTMTNYFVTLKTKHCRKRRQSRESYDGGLTVLTQDTMCYISQVTITQKARINTELKT